MFIVVKLKLHPKAHDCLFQHYRALRNIFHDVLGHLELDYVSMVLIGSSQELIFFSSLPSIELNLIELDLWRQDPILLLRDIGHEKFVAWDEVYNDAAFFTLKHYKMKKPGIVYGLSLPARFREFQVIYSFGKFQHGSILDQGLVKNIGTLKAMGKYCLQNIFEVVTVEELLAQSVEKKRHLYVVHSQADSI